MEPTFYDDGTNQSGMKNIRKTMTLDFNNPHLPTKKLKVSHNTTLLSSPDLNMLKLGSPELEKLIIQQNGVVTTTPTPTQFIFPKNVTEEQELYARGFVDALAELHNSDSGLSETSETNGGMGLNNHALPPFFSVHIKEEPQTVPNFHGSPPLSPINMESQEKIKLERKRQRNRVAASKCRKRKLERISRLEDKVRLMKGENSELGNVVIKLRQQVCQLKEQVMTHVNRGCQMMVTQNY